MAHARLTGLTSELNAGLPCWLADKSRAAPGNYVVALLRAPRARSRLRSNHLTCCHSFVHLQSAPMFPELCAREKRGP